LGYRDLKDIARASLEHAFLPGESLWRAGGDYRSRRACARDVPGAGRPGVRCRALLHASEKAAVQWEQEVRSRRFERLAGR
jgi:adenosine deaminase